MALSDSMFLFEIFVEKLTSIIDCKKIQINCQFADVFSLNLKDPNILPEVLPRSCEKTKYKRKKVRINKTPLKGIPIPKVQSGQSILIADNIDMLILRMRAFPMELSFWSITNPENKLGSTHIRWNQKYIDYLNKLNKNLIPPPITVVEEYNVFDEITSRRMATIQLYIKLCHLEDRIPTQFEAISKNNLENFIYNRSDSQPTTTLNKNKENHNNLGKGVIKTIYRGNNNKTSNKSKHNYKFHKIITQHRPVTEMYNNKLEDEIEEVMETIKFVDHLATQGETNINRSIVDLIKSENSIEKNHDVNVRRSKSLSSLNFLTHFNPSNRFSSNQREPFGNQVYCVGYFTVEKDASLTSKESLKRPNSEKSEDLKAKYKFQVCNSLCPSKKEIACSDTQSSCSLNLSDEAAHLISVIKCQQIDCNKKKQRGSPPPPDDRILLDLNLKRSCCDITNKLEELMGTMETKTKFSQDPCFCSCECTFGFTKKTTYCNICTGYQRVGDEMAGKGVQVPFPCPIYHKLVDKNKLKTWSTSGSDIKKKGDDSQKSLKVSSKFSSPDKKGPEKIIESETDKKVKKKNDRFKFNYGYEAPQIGHSRCAISCTRTQGTVPKNMGWLWTAEDVPGLKFRPKWIPGATNKHVVRLLKMAKNPGEVIAKKKRKNSLKKKRPVKRPLLVVQKKDGEYIVTMETMKTYAKPRALNQHPYEDKPVLTYTIGRTDEENRERKKKKERAQRRLERAQRQFIQSAFRDVCHEICLKTYQQALGILPDAESPKCFCYPAQPDANRTSLDVSCSCSEDKSSICSDTDEDEWIIEFTPPIASFDPTFKPKKIVRSDNGSQYTYLDYKVKLFDKYGNPVPRFFRGPDGKQQCSDLGGFWSPDHTWLEINVDGFIAPDGRWAPAFFTGPNGEQIEAEDGKFQTVNGVWLVIGVDGYVDSQKKWRFYPKLKGKLSKKQFIQDKRHGAGDKKLDKAISSVKKSETTFSCLGDVSPKILSKMGIIGHGQDKKIMLSALKELLARGEQVNIPEPSMVPRSPVSKKDKKVHMQAVYQNVYQHKCRHPVPSEKGVVAVDAHGNKTYFRLKSYATKIPNWRLERITEQGISLSSFHVPCFHSFINGEIMKQQERDRLMALSRNVQSTGVSTEA